MGWRQPLISVFTPFKPVAAALAGFLLLCAQTILAQTANFTSDKTEGCFPLTVGFQDTSTGTITSWLWDFGNGNTSTLQNPGAVFSAPGSYNVSLTVSNGGQPSTRIRSAYIVVHDAPAADFSFNTSSGCAPLSVKFNDNTSASSGQITSWFWVFGDGGTSTQANPTYVFKDPGSRTVTLRVKNEFGCEKLKTSSSPIVVLGPTAKFVSDKQAVCTTPAQFQFTNQSTGTGLTYQWTFGDGQTSTSVSPSHTYGSAGTFNVVLKAKDGNGCEHSYSMQVNAGSEGGLDFDASPLKVCLGEEIDFTLISTDAPVSSSWNFGDGGTANINDPSYTYSQAGTYTVTLSSLLLNHTCNSIARKTVVVAAPATPNFTSSVDCNYNLTLTSTSANTSRVEWYIEDELVSAKPSFVSPLHAPGVQLVKLIAFDQAGCSVELTKGVSVPSNPAPAFEPDEQQACDGPSLSGCAPFKVKFTNTTVSSVPITMLWDFGDRSISTETSPLHTYVSKGLYQVSLTATDGRGCKGVATAFVDVADKSPVADFTIDKSSACAGEEVTFTDKSTDATFWCWDFGDNTKDIGKNIKHKYAKPGTYTVTLTAKNAGCASVKKIVNAVTIKDPYVIFSSVKSCAEPHKISITANSSENYDEMHWEFGDGQTSTAINPGSHTYAEEGVYLLQLFGTNHATGCTTVAYQDVVIQDIKADFDVNTSKPCKDSPIVFKDKSHAAVKWEWVVAGQHLTGPNPETKLSTPGNFTAQLKVSDSDNCFDSKTIPITVLNMDGNFKYTATSNCDEFTVSFENQSTGFPAPTVWEWNFGDGETSTDRDPVHAYEDTGEYNVSLSVTNADGTCVYSKENAVEFTNPIPSFESAKTVFCPDEVVTIANTTKNAVSYEWDYGDGRRSDFLSPQIQYPTTGSYDITLFAMDAFGCEKKLTKEDFVVIAKPTADFSVEAAFSECPPFTALFKDESGATAKKWQWWFGDGNGSTLKEPANIYLDPGKFDVSLTVTDENGCVDTKFKNQFVNVGGPTGKFVTHGSNQCTNQTVTFSATTENTEVLRWDFGDGNVVESTSSEASHSYTSTGTFTPTLLLIDIRGCQTVADGSKVLQIKDTTVISMSVSPACIKAGEPFMLEGKNESDISDWTWFVNEVPIGNGNKLQTTLDEPGAYTITGRATNVFDCISHITDTVRIQGPITLIPNVITPNGDLRNQTFKIIGLENSIWNVDIFNRWGNTVYSKKNYRGEWDGEEQPAGVYYYILRNAVCEDREYKGFLSVIRQD